MAPTKHGTEHLDSGALLDLAEGARPLARHRTHLERCGTCRDALAGTESLVAEMRADRLPDPPERLVARAVALFPARPPLAVRVVESVARLVRGAGSPALAGSGVRGEAAVPARLLYRGQGLEVDVEVTPHGAQWRVAGQAFPGRGRALPLLVWAERDGVSLAEAAVSDAGTFQIEAVPEGPFDLVLDGGERRLRLPVRPSGSRRTRT